MRVLSTYFQEFQAIAAASDTNGRPLAKPSEINQFVHLWVEFIDQGRGPIETTLFFWESVLRWRTIAENEKADPASLQWLDGKVSAYQLKIDQLKHGYDQLNAQARLLVDLTDRYLEPVSAEKDTSGITQQP